MRCVLRHFWFVRTHRRTSLSVRHVMLEVNEDELFPVKGCETLGAIEGKAT
jgi:hypothetical protein